MAHARRVQHALRDGDPVIWLALGIAMLSVGMFAAAVVRD